MLVLLWGISCLSHMLLLYFQLHITVAEIIYCFAIISYFFKYLWSFLDPFIKILTDLWVFKGNLSHHAPLLNSISKFTHSPALVTLWGQFQLAAELHDENLWNPFQFFWLDTLHCVLCSVLHLLFLYLNYLSHS